MLQTKLRGTGGEFFTAFLLSAHWGMEVLIADSEGFDLLAKDPKGRLPGKQTKAISVKSRVRKDDKSLTFNIENSRRSLCREAKAWNAEPYFAFLAFHRFEGEGQIHFMLVRACRENRHLFGPGTFKFRRARRMKSTKHFRYFVLPLQEPQ